jgi:hypothetical protein
VIELLEDPAYRHMLLNHVPVIGLATAAAVLACGMALRQASMVRLGLVLVVLTAGIAFPVARFGDAAYPAIFDELDGAGRAWLDYHADLADRWLILLYTASAVAFAALLLSWLRPRLLLALAATALVFGLAGFGTAAWIAMAGGKIKHPEFRMDDPPRLESSRRLG